MASLSVSSVQCSICRDPADEETYLLCGHGYCRGCITGWINSQITERKTQVLCPDVNCRQEIDDGIVEILVGREQFSLYDQSRLNLVLEKDFVMFYCPNAECKNIVSVQDNKVRHVQCPACAKSFCFQCKVDWHSDTTCEKYQEWARENGQAEALTFQLLNRMDAKQCPKCNSWIEKNMGCDHMTCQKCRYEFWWSTLEHYPEGRSAWTPALAVPQPVPFNLENDPILDRAPPLFPGPVLPLLGGMLARPAERQRINDEVIPTRRANEIINAFRRPPRVPSVWTPPVIHDEDEVKVDVRDAGVHLEEKKASPEDTVAEIERLFRTLNPTDQGRVCALLARNRDFEIPVGPYTAANLGILTVEQLKRICRSQRLTQGGTKAILIERIITHQRQQY